MQELPNPWKGATGQGRAPDPVEGLPKPVWHAVCYGYALRTPIRCAYTDYALWPPIQCA